MKRGGDPSRSLDVMQLHPYAKGVILEYTGNQPHAIVVVELAVLLQQMYRDTAGRTVRVVAEGFGEHVVRR
jgi:hypothetical protein